MGRDRPRDSVVARELRAELAELDVQLKAATASLQRQRDTFGKDVSTHDLKLVERTRSVQQAWREFEAEKQQMESLHKQLEEERSALEEIQAASGAFEATLASTREATREHPSAQPGVAAGRAALGLGLHTTFRNFLDGAAGAAEATVAVVTQRLGRVLSRLRALGAALRLRAAPLPGAHFRLGSSGAGAGIEASTGSTGTTGTTGTIGAARAGDDAIWDAETVGLLRALREAEDVATEQLAYVHARERVGSPSSSNACGGDVSVRAEVAKTRLQVVTELRSGLSALLGRTS